MILDQNEEKNLKALILRGHVNNMKINEKQTKAPLFKKKKKTTNFTAAGDRKGQK